VENKVKSEDFKDLMKKSNDIRYEYTIKELEMVNEIEAIDDYDNYEKSSVRR